MKREGLNIVHLYDGHEKVYNGRGSVPSVVWNIAKKTTERGHNVTIIERKWDTLKKIETHEGVKFHRIDLTTGANEPWERIPYQMISTLFGKGKLLLDRINFAIQSLRELRSMDFDLLHVHLPFAANVLIMLAPRLRDKIVYTAHIGETEERIIEPKFSPDVFLANRIARIIVLNNKMKSAFNTRGTPLERLTVIPNGVDLDRFQKLDQRTRRNVEMKYGLEVSQVILFVGTVTPRKGVIDLIEAAGKSLADRDNTKLVIVGKTDLQPEYLNRVQETVRSLNLEKKVEFTGFVPENELLSLYMISDIFVLPSYEEGSSIAISEATAAKTPVIGTRIDGIARQITPEVHGLLVEPGNTDELSNALEELLTNHQKRKVMENALKDRAEELSWAQITDEIISIYKEIK